MQVRDVMKAMEDFAPTCLKEDWDNVGLQIGDPAAPVERVLLALTPCEAVVREAIDQGADMIVAHHPFLFKGAKTLRSDTAIGRVSQLCMKHDIALYCAHTNLDVTAGGVNDVLAERLGLVGTEGLVETWSQPRYKLVTFVPPEALESVKQALFAAGAGAQGCYEACAWQVSGRGQFRPEAGADPYLGAIGALCESEEVRLEVLVDADRLAGVLTALLTAHPYEVPAYDVLRNEAGAVHASIGRIGRLPAPRLLSEWLGEIKERLAVPVVTFAGDGARMIQTVALCGGSAVEYLDAAKARGADVYVTGDMKYHDAQKAVEIGLPMVDVSHYGGERPVLWRLQTLFEECFGASVDVVISENETNFMQYI